MTTYFCSTCNHMFGSTLAVELCPCCLQPTLQEAEAVAVTPNEDLPDNVTPLGPAQKTTWICGNCKQLTDGDVLPDICPTCDEDNTLRPIESPEVYVGVQKITEECCVNGNVVSACALFARMNEDGQINYSHMIMGERALANISVDFFKARLIASMMPTESQC